LQGIRTVETATRKENTIWMHLNEYRWMRDGNWLHTNSLRCRLPIAGLSGTALTTSLYNEVERAVWQELGREVGVIARAFGMPLGTHTSCGGVCGGYKGVSSGLNTVTRSGTLRPDEAELTIRKCAMVERAREAGENPLAACNVCHAFANAAIPDLNRNYAPKYRGSICAGDSTCSVTIIPRQE
jgi:hypothetical protein